MENYTKKLPIHIVYKILSYFHKEQPIDLLHDIKHFYNSTNIILYYYEIKMLSFDQLYNNAIHDWLVNDLFLYMNLYMPTMWGYMPKFYKIILRNPFINPNSRQKYYYPKNLCDDSDYTYKTYMYIRNLDKLPSSRVFNLLWGLFHKKEREHFIEMTIREINHLYEID
jgi:hypothetical protein